MHRSYRLRLEKMIEQHELDQELLIHCIAVINKRVNRAYASLQKLTAYHDYDLEWEEYQRINHLPPYYSVRDIDVSEAKKKLEELITYRKPFLELLMKEYKISLDHVKSLVAQADKNKNPTFEMVETIHEMIIHLRYRLI